MSYHICSVILFMNTFDTKAGYIHVLGVSDTADGMVC